MSDKRDLQTLTTDDVGTVDLTPPAPPPPTLADRLNALCEKVGEGARYAIETIDGGYRITITDKDSGDRFGGTGDTRAAAIAALETKLGIGQ